MRRISHILEEANVTARYMASYGMNNSTSYVEAPRIFGNLQHFLDIDAGREVPFDLMPNFGLGEVIDATPQSLFYTKST